MNEDEIAVQVQDILQKMWQRYCEKIDILPEDVYYRYYRRKLEEWGPGVRKLLELDWELVDWA